MLVLLTILSIIWYQYVNLICMKFNVFLTVSFIYISVVYHRSIIYTVHYYTSLNELLLMYIGGNTFCIGSGRPHVTEQYCRRAVLEFPNLLKMIFFMYVIFIYLHDEFKIVWNKTPTFHFGSLKYIHKYNCTSTLVECVKFE